MRVVAKASASRCCGDGSVLPWRRLLYAGRYEFIGGNGMSLDCVEYDRFDKGTFYYRTTLFEA